MKKIIVIGSILACFIALLSSSLIKKNEVLCSKQSNYNPKDGYVPDEKTAIKIAEAIWLPIYGKKMLDNEKPFKATLKSDSVWVVEGTLKAGMDGGTAYAEIQKKDCKVLKVTHYK